MKPIYANFQPAVNHQSLDKSAPFSSADNKTALFLHLQKKLDFPGAEFLSLNARFRTMRGGGYWSRK